MNTMLLFSLFALQADPSAKLQFDRTQVDRGEIKSGVPLVEKFKLSNPTRRSVTITSLTGGCGCLKPRLSSQVILPGETAEVTFEVNTLSQPVGANRWQLQLKYQVDGETEIQQSLEVTAKLVREIRLDPNALVVVTSDAMSRDFTLHDDRLGGLKIREVKSSIPELKLGILNADGVAKRSTHLIRIHLPESAPAGDYHGTLSILTDDPDYPELRVPLQIIKRSPNEVQASPDELSLRLSETQLSASGIVRLKDGQDREVQIEKVECDHSAIRSKHVPGPGKMSTLRVIVTPDANTRRGETVVRVHLKSPEKKVLSIPVRWGE